MTAVIRADGGAAGTPDRRIYEGHRMPLFTRKTPPSTAAAGGTSRRTFVRASSGYAAGAVAVVGLPAAVLLETDAEAATAAPKTVKNPTTDVPEGPVMAYVHDAKQGIVVIMDGTTERTVQDRALVDKLLRAPKKAKKAKKRRRPRSKPVTATDRRKGRR